MLAGSRHPGVLLGSLPCWMPQGENWAGKISQSHCSRTPVRFLDLKVSCKVWLLDILILSDWSQFESSWNKIRSKKLKSEHDFAIIWSQPSGLPRNWTLAKAGCVCREEFCKLFPDHHVSPLALSCKPSSLTMITIIMSEVATGISKPKPRVLSLFSGVGGLELGLSSPDPKIFLMLLLQLQVKFRRCGNHLRSFSFRVVEPIGFVWFSDVPKAAPDVNSLICKLQCLGYN